MNGVRVKVNLGTEEYWNSSEERFKRKVRGYEGIAVGTLWHPIDGPAVVVADEYGGLAMEKMENVEAIV